MRCGFWPLVQWYVFPWSWQSFPKERTARVSSRSIILTNKSNCLTYTVTSSLVCLTDRMHTRSWINNKLSFFRLFCWRSREYPFLRGRVECSLVFFCELINEKRKIPSLASGTSLLSLSLFMGPALKFHSVGTSLMINFDIYFSQRWSFRSPDTWRSVDLVNRTLWISSKTCCIGFHRDLLPWETSASESCDTQPNCDTLFTIATAFLSSLSHLFGKLLFFGFLFGCSPTL